MLRIRDKFKFFNHRQQTFFSFSLGVMALFLFTSHIPTPPSRPNKPTPPSRNQVKPTATPKPKKVIVSPLPTNVVSTPVPTTAPTPLQVQPASSGKLLIGIGSEADGAVETRLAKEAPVHMLSSWYNKPEDLTWMTTWKNSFIPSLYAKGYTLHLITFSDFPEVPLTTTYGPACGRAYPLSSRYVDDMRQLAETYRGDGPLYVTLFTEFQTYPCTDNTWIGSENYYRALMDQYRAVRKVFKETAPNAQVAISWGGWQSRWDDQAKGGGLSLIPYFADLMRESDFTAFQAMETGSNLQDIKDMSRILGGYKKPVMLSHYKPDNGSQATFNADMQGIFSDSFITEVTGNGLFALSFMDNANLTQSDSTYQFINASVKKYGK